VGDVKLEAYNIVLYWWRSFDGPFIGLVVSMLALLIKVACWNIVLLICEFTFGFGWRMIFSLLWIAFATELMFSPLSCSPTVAVTARPVSPQNRVGIWMTTTLRGAIFFFRVNLN